MVRCEIFFLLLHIVKLVFGYQRELKTLVASVSTFQPGDMADNDWNLICDISSNGAVFASSVKLAHYHLIS